MEEYDNDRIINWAKKNFDDIKRTIDAMGIKHYPKSPNPKALKNNITLKFKKDRDGMINRISYGMPRSGVFEHKGVSSGHPIGNPRTAKKWFDTPTNKNMDELQKIVAENDVNYIVNNLQIK